MDWVLCRDTDFTDFTDDVVIFDGSLKDLILTLLALHEDTKDFGLQVF